MGFVYIKKITFSFVASSLLFFGMSSLHVYAEEIVITANGADSVSTTENVSSTETSVQQANSASITNTIQTTSETGNNTASNNEGSVSITTGDASITTDVQNQANVSSVQQVCCNPDGSSTIISENGEGSLNTVTNADKSHTSVIVTQTATIKNTITGVATTGNNTASGNTGNVSIRTGNITAVQNINNSPVNISSVRVPQSGATASHLITISGNGEGSVNRVLNGSDYITTVGIANVAEFINDTTLLLITGGNIATVNVGNVDIATGDIIATTTITNRANISDVVVGCCDPKDEDPTENQPSTPAPTTISVGSSNASSGGSGSGNGAVQGVSAEKILPATGNIMAIIFLIGNMLMLLMGAYLRLRSGRSPALEMASL